MAEFRSKFLMIFVTIHAVWRDVFNNLYSETFDFHANPFGGELGTVIKLFPSTRH